MSGESLSREWLDIAEIDLNTAVFLLDMRPVPIEVICYHCEQAAEKLLKAVLVHHDIEAPKTHDLVHLCKLCMEVEPDYEQLMDACAELTPYGVQIRYPSHLELEGSDMASALAECRKLDGFIRERLIFEEEQTNQGPPIE